MPKTSLSLTHQASLWSFPHITKNLQNTQTHLPLESWSTDATHGRIHKETQLQVMSKEFENKHDLDVQNENQGTDFMMQDERKEGGFEKEANKLLMQLKKNFEDKAEKVKHSETAQRDKKSWQIWNRN